jgi:hypothetical protein
MATLLPSDGGLISRRTSRSNMDCLITGYVPITTPTCIFLNLLSRSTNLRPPSPHITTITTPRALYAPHRPYCLAAGSTSLPHPTHAHAPISHAWLSAGGQQHAEDEYHSEQSPSRPPRSRTFAWLPSRPSSTETPEEDPEAEREIASSVSVADDLLGTSRGSRWQGASQQRQQGYRASSDHFSTHPPGSLPRVSGSQTTWSGGYATTATAPRASPPIRTPQALSSLFDQPHDDDSEDDMSADEDDGEDLSEEESGDFAPAEQRWIDTLAARHRAQFGAAANHGQHTWHGADSRLAEGWSEVLRARQVGRTAEDSHTTPRAPPACGR